jgi:hypothetical protein
MLRSTLRYLARSLTRRPSPARKSLRARPWQPALEELESRLVPTVSLKILNGVLTAQCGDIGSNTVTVDHVVLAGKGFAEINGHFFSDARYQSIQINGGAGGTVTNIHGNVKPLTVFGASAKDVVNLGDTSNKLHGILGTVLLEDEKGFKATVNINDQGDTTTNLTATLSTVTRPGGSSLGQLTGLSAPISWDYGDTSAVNLHLGTGTGTVNVNGTGPLTTNITTAAQIAIFNVGNGNVAANIQGQLNLQPLVSGGQVHILDNNDNQGRTATLSTVSRLNQSSLGQLSGLGSGVITWDSLSTGEVFVVGGIGADTFNIQGIPVTTEVTANAPAIMNVGSGGSVAGIQGLLFLKNNSGANNTVNISAQNDTKGADFFQDGGNFSPQSGFFTVSGLFGDVFFDTAGTSAVNLNSGTADVFVEGTVVTTNIFSTANTAITVGNSGSVAGIRGALNLENDHGGRDTITIDDSNDSAGRTFIMARLPGDESGNTFDQLSSTNAMTGVITWDNADTLSVTLNGGSGGNTFDIEDTGTNTTINGGIDHNFFNVVPIRPLEGLGTAIVGTLTLNGNPNSVLNLNDQNDPNSETLNFSIPSFGSGTLTLGTTPTFDLVFNNMGSVNLFTNATSSVKAPPGTVNVSTPTTL